jgi:hypothetical protein
MPVAFTMDGDEQCSSCLQLYWLEMRRHCVHCDGAVCPFCMVKVEAELVCLGCKEVADAGARDVEG